MRFGRNQIWSKANSLFPDCSIVLVLGSSKTASDKFFAVSGKVTLRISIII